MAAHPQCLYCNQPPFGTSHQQVHRRELPWIHIDFLWKQVLPNFVVNKDFLACCIASVSCLSYFWCVGLINELLHIDISDKGVMLTTAKPISNRPVTERVNNGQNWFGILKYSMEKGLVYRLFRIPGNEVDIVCRTGIMEKAGSKWVWKGKSISELNERGIYNA